MPEPTDSDMAAARELSMDPRMEYGGVPVDDIAAIISRHRSEREGRKEKVLREAYSLLQERHATDEHMGDVAETNESLLEMLRAALSSDASEAPGEENRDAEA